MAMDLSLPLFGVVAVAAVFILYHSMRAKVEIKNPDGTYVEKNIKGGQRVLDFDGGIYNLKDEGFYRKLFMGVLPMTRITFLKGCSEPVAHHSGVPVLHTDDLKIPMYGDYECPKCKTKTNLIGKLLMAPQWRVLLMETVTAKIGKPKPQALSLKTLIIIIAIIGVVVTVAAIASKFMGGGGAKVPTTVT